MRKAPIYNYIALGVVVCLMGAFLGGLCAHSFISTVILSGLFVATFSLAVGANLTLASGKSRRLKQMT